MQRYFVFVTPSQKLIVLDDGNGGNAMLHLLPNSCGTCSTWQTPTNCCHSSSSCFAFSFRPACSVLRWLIDLWIRGKFRAGKVAGNLCIFLVDFPFAFGPPEAAWTAMAVKCKWLLEKITYLGIVCLPNWFHLLSIPEMIGLAIVQVTPREQGKLNTFFSKYITKIYTRTD